MTPDDVTPGGVARTDPRLAELLRACFGGRWDYPPGGRILGLFAGDVLAAAGCHSLLGEDAALLHTGCVRPDHRGLGLHRRLVRVRLDALRAAGRRTAYAAANRYNAAVLANLRAEGFSECGPVRGVTVVGNFVTLAADLTAE